MFPKQEDAFKDYTVIGKVVLDKSVEEMQTYLQTGEFPASTSKKVDRTSSETTSNIPTSSWGTPTNVKTPWEASTQSRTPWEAPLSSEPKSPTRFF